VAQYKKNSVLADQIIIYIILANKTYVRGLPVYK